MASLKAMLIQAETSDQKSPDLKVYLDSRGRPTVGIGHLVQSKDKLKVGDTIDEKRAFKFFAADVKFAQTAAKSQAADADIDDADFLVYLTMVNFQLGPKKWMEFKKTWAFIMAKDYEKAAKEVAKSKWAKETPKRVKQFQGALRSLAEQKGAAK